MKLTDSQREAIESWERGDVSIVAGPGSGKTTVLVEHFRWLVEKRGVAPHQILAITFTEKAANNMHERLVREAPTHELRQEFERAQISTIDAFCNRLLREHALEIGIDPDFRILDPSEQEVEMRRVVGEVLNDVFKTDPQGTYEFLGAFAGSNRHADEFQVSHVHDQIYQLYGAVRAWAREPFVRERDLPRVYNELIAELGRVAQERNSTMIAKHVQNAPQATDRMAAEHLAWLAGVEQTVRFLVGGTKGSRKGLTQAIQKELLRSILAIQFSARYEDARRWVMRTATNVGETYERWKIANGTLDFSDLVERTVQFLKGQPDLRSQFRYILIDEYQDTNTTQARLAELLHSAGEDRRVLFAVGDINQSIYGFRHADPEVFRDYRESVRKNNGHLVDLRENFRSRPEILRAVEKILGNAQGIEPHTLIAGAKFAPKAIPSVEVFIARDEEFLWKAEEREALHTAARIFDLHETLNVGDPPRAARWSDFAILLRTHTLVSRFAATLRRAGVPYQLSAGRGFFESPEVRDLVQLLRVLRNPRDEIGLAAVLRSPLVGISDEALMRMKIAARNLSEALRHPPALDANDAARLERFRERFDTYRRIREDQPADLLLSRLVAETGYEAWLLSLPGGLQQAANLHKLLAIVRSMRRDRDLSFAELVARLEKLRKVGTPETEASVQDSAEDAVHLMTMHAAKGLEFPIVFLPCLQSGQRSDSDPLLFSPTEGIGISWLDVPTGEGAGDLAYFAIRESERLLEQQESNRLFYVAMTRAEEHLVLSASIKTNVTNWAKQVRDNLEIDFKLTDNKPIIEQRDGWQFRLFRTSEDPASLRPVLEHPRLTNIVWVDRAVPGDASDSEAAVTSIALFAECPRRYYLSRYLGFDESKRRSWRSPAASSTDDALPAELDEIDATELGQRVHGVLAGSLPIDRLSGEALRLVENFRGSDLARQAGTAEVVTREQHLTFSIDGRLLRGQIDLWFDAGGRRFLVDYKTDDVTAEDARERLRAYGLQLQLYSLALEQASGAIPNKAVAYFLRPDIALDVDLRASALDQARGAVARFFAAQSDLNFPLHVAEHCLRCPHYRGMCPARLSSIPMIAEEARGGEITAVPVEAEPVAKQGTPPAVKPLAPRAPDASRKVKPDRGSSQLSLPFQKPGD